MKKVCEIEDLIKDSGICVLVDDKQIAIFYIDDNVYAIDNYDPIGKAYVLARGIVGDIDGRIVVASPLYKEHYDLKTGECVEHIDISVETYKCEISDGVYVDS